MINPKLSVCILTQDNADTIKTCIDSVKDIADEIIVIDGGSKDGTLEILEKIPRLRIINNPFVDIASQRNIYLKEAKGEWIFYLDADEFVGDEFKKEVTKLMQYEEFTQYWLPRYWLASTNPLKYLRNEVNYPDHQLRLFKNSPGLQFTQKVHQQISIPGRQKWLDKPHIFHLMYLRKNRQEREERLKQYEELSPGSGSGIYRKYYMYEEYPHEVLDCTETASCIVQKNTLWKRVMRAVIKKFK